MSQSILQVRGRIPVYLYSRAKPRGITLNKDYVKD